MSSSRSVLSQRKAEVSQIVHGCVMVRSRVMLESPRAVAVKVREGIAYGHSIVLEKNLALWPLEFTIESTIKSKSQLKYGQSQDPTRWVFTTSLLPDDGDEQITLLLCVKNESGRDELRSLLVSNAGAREMIVLGVDIE